MDLFYSSKTNKDGKSGTCKGCANEKSKAWKLKNVEAHKKYKRDWARKERGSKKTDDMKSTSAYRIIYNNKEPKSYADYLRDDKKRVIVKR